MPWDPPVTIAVLWEFVISKLSYSQLPPNLYKFTLPDSLFLILLLVKKGLSIRILQFSAPGSGTRDLNRGSVLWGSGCAQARSLVSCGPAMMIRPSAIVKLCECPAFSCTPSLPLSFTGDFVA